MHAVSQYALSDAERARAEVGNSSCYLAVYDTDPSTGPTTTVLADDKLLELQAETLYIYLACALAEAADLILSMSCRPRMYCNQADTH